MSTLDKLKQQVKTISDQQQMAMDLIDYNEEEIKKKEMLEKKNQEEMNKIIRRSIGKEELANARERQMLQDTLQAFSHRQKVMNEEIVKLNDNLTDVTSLQAVYEAKKNELELNYENQKIALQGQIKALERRIDNRSYELEQIEENIGRANGEMVLLQKNLKKFTLLDNIKSKDSICFFLVVLAASAIFGFLFGMGAFDWLKTLLFKAI